MNDHPSQHSPHPALSNRVDCDDNKRPNTTENAEIIKNVPEANIMFF